MTTPGPSLSRVRTVVLWGLAVVWFTETMFLGVFARTWSSWWQVAVPDDRQLATALFALWSVGAPTKAALGVLAVYAIRSRDVSARTALYASMALVPPLNIAFPFRYQGFLPGPVTVATVLSTILWGSFLLFRERAPQVPTPSPRPVSPTWWEVVRYAWFAANAAALTLLALFKVFAAPAALASTLPCLAGPVAAAGAQVSGLINPTMGSGTHLLAFATASWFATVRCRDNPTLRHALTAASTVHAGLFLVFPIRQIATAFGRDCAVSSSVMLFVLLAVGWVLYAVADAFLESARGEVR